MYEPVTKSIKGVSEDVTRAMMETSRENSKALENLKDKLFETMKNRGVIAPSLLSLLLKIINPEHTSQLKLIKDPSSSRVIDLLKNKTKTVTLYNNLLRFGDIDRDRDRELELQGDFLKMITNRHYNVDLAILPDKKNFF